MTYRPGKSFINRLAQATSKTGLMIYGKLRDSSKAAPPTAVIMNGRTMQSSLESSVRAGYDGYKRCKGSKVHIAVDTLGHLLAFKVTAANEQERVQVGDLAKQIQEVTGNHVELAYVDQGYTGQQVKEDVQAH